jgi:hypothetical protein
MWAYIIEKQFFIEYEIYKSLKILFLNIILLLHQKQFSKKNINHGEYAHSIQKRVDISCLKKICIILKNNLLIFQTYN